MGRLWSTANDRIYSASSIAIEATGTIGIWVCPATSPQGVWNFGDGSGQDYPGFQRYAPDGNIYAGFGHDTNSRIVFNGSGYFANGVWAHHAFTWSVADGQRLYKNAVSTGTPTAYAHTAHSYGYTIGNWTVATTNRWDGVLSDFTYWNVVLSANEISSLVNGTRPDQIRRSSLKIWLPLFGFDTPEPDFSGNALNGTVSGPTLSQAGPVNMITPKWPINDLFPGVAPSFIPAWAAQSNLPVIGAGTF